MMWSLSLPKKITKNWKKSWRSKKDKLHWNSAKNLQSVRSILPRITILLFLITSTKRMHFRFSNNLFSRQRSEEHTSELQSREKLVCRLLLEKKKARWSGRRRRRAGTRGSRSGPVARYAGAIAQRIERSRGTRGRYRARGQSDGGVPRCEIVP